jgi:hypothetical protein
MPRRHTVLHVSFMNRRTDLYVTMRDPKASMGFPPGKAEELVSRALVSMWPHMHAPLTGALSAVGGAGLQVVPFSRAARDIQAEDGELRGHAGRPFTARGCIAASAAAQFRSSGGAICNPVGRGFGRCGGSAAICQRTRPCCGFGPDGRAKPRSRKHPQRTTASRASCFLSCCACCRRAARACARWRPVRCSRGCCQTGGQRRRH